MMRALLAVMAGLLCALGGVRYASALKGEAARLKRWEQLLLHLALLVQEGTSSLPDALRQAASGQFLPDKLLQGMASAVSKEPLTSLADAFIRLCDDVQEKDALYRMFMRLGRGSKDARALAVQQCAKEVSLLASAASERAEKDAKLWTTLGMTGGACITLFLL